MSKPNALTKAMQEELLKAAFENYVNLSDYPDASDWAMDQVRNLNYYAIREIIEEGNILDLDAIVDEAWSRTDDEVIKILNDPRACPDEDEDHDDE